MVKVTEINLLRSQEHVVLSGRIDGLLTQFKYPPYIQVTARAEPFLGLALLKAMSEDEDLEIDPKAPLDPEIISNLPVIQSILRQWNPHFNRIHVSCRPEPVPDLNAGVLSSFSGGVDSSCTLAEHEAEITHLLTINSFDNGDVSEDFGALKAKIEALALKLNKSVVPVETNARLVSGELGLSWNYAHGPVLCLIAVSLGFEAFYVPSSHTYADLFPWGSHPSLDPLWRTRRSTIIHDGLHHLRSEKLSIVGSRPELLGQLQVCWRAQTENCGRCAKCTRTMIVAQGLGLSGAPFPNRPLDKLVRSFKLKSESDAKNGGDLAHFLRSQGHLELGRILVARLRWFRLEQQFRRFAKFHIGATLTDAIRRSLGHRKVERKVRIISPDETL